MCLKINCSVKTPWHRPSMEVALSGLLIHGFSCHSFKFLWKTVNTKPPTIPFGIVVCTLSDNLSRNSCILKLLIFIPSNPVFFFLDTTFSIKNCKISADLYVKPTDPINTPLVHLVIYTTQKDPSPIALDRSVRPHRICLDDTTFKKRCVN